MYTFSYYKIIFKIIYIKSFEYYKYYFEYFCVLKAVDIVSLLLLSIKKNSGGRYIGLISKAIKLCYKGIIISVEKESYILCLSIEGNFQIFSSIFALFVHKFRFVFLVLSKFNLTY